MPSLLVSGAINWDTTLFVDVLPKPGQEVRVRKTLSVPGGKGANTAVAAARILGSGEVAIIGMLGSDEIANAQISTLKAEGIDTTCLSMQSTLTSGKAFVVVDGNGENMILTHHAANTKVTREFASTDAVRHAITNVSAVVIIDPPLAAAAELVDRAKLLGKKIMFSPATLSYDGFSSLELILLAADYVVVNEHEAQLLAPAGEGEAACEKLSTLLRGRPVITTLGRLGSMICAQGRKEIVPGIDPGLIGLKVVNTVGAGDTLVGSFAAFKVLGMQDLQALFLASVAAALKVTREETRGSPTYSEILRIAESETLRNVYNQFRVR